MGEKIVSMKTEQPRKLLKRDGHITKMNALSEFPCWGAGLFGHHFIRSSHRGRKVHAGYGQYIEVEVPLWCIISNADPGASVQDYTSLDRKGKDRMED